MAYQLPTEIHHKRDALKISFGDAQDTLLQISQY